ncbi:hypothetical protein ACFLYY_00855 [Patescibacteria group bacterium]
MLRKRIIFLLIIFVVVLSAVGFWYWQKNVYSKDVLRLEILGPETVEFAKEFEYSVKYKNNGDVRLEGARLVFEYPEHAIVDEDKNLRQEIFLEDIYPGEEKTINFKGRLIGQEGELFTAKADLGYNPKGLKARFESNTTFTTQLKPLSLTFEFDLPSKIEPDSDFKFRINYFSNIDYPLSNLRITVEYPLEFEFISSSPNSLEQIEWEVPPLNKAEGGRVEISGKLNGNIGDQKIFGANIGTWKNGEFILLKEINKGVEIVNPSLRISQQINGDQDYVANPEDQLHYEIFFKNVGEGPLTNLSLISSLSGEIFDFSTLIAPNGDFTVGDNSIVWDWKKVSTLQVLNSQREGKVDFWIKLKPLVDITDFSNNLSIQNSVYLNQVKEDFLTKVNAGLEIVQRGFFYDEIFGNNGPIPPKVGQTTTYTINWQVKNYYNEVKNVRVKAILPQNVQLTGKIFPEGSRLTFDSQSKEIVWEVGDLQTGQGVLSPAPNVSFQINFTSEAFQTGQTPDIIGQAKITGEDYFTGRTVEDSDSAINTSLPDDSSVNNQGTIQF